MLHTNVITRGNIKICKFYKQIFQWFNRNKYLLWEGEGSMIKILLKKWEFMS